MLNSRSETRGISFVVRAVFVQKRSRSGLLQVRDGHVDSGLSNSRFVLQQVGFLEDGDLRLVLVVELLQRLQLAGGVLKVKSRLLPVAI